MSSQGREHLRFDAKIPVRFANTEDFLTEYTKNISMGGVFVRMRKPLGFGTIVRLQIEPPGTTEPIEVTGKVVFVVTPQSAKKEGKEPGIGVRFQEVSDEARDALAECVRNLSHSHAGRVLVVDNDSEHVKELSAMLRELRFNVVTVASAIKGLDILWRQPFDLIISAVSIPRMDGLEFRDTLRRDPDAASIPFVFMAANPQEEDREVGDRLGVKHFLHKPVTRNALREVVNVLTVGNGKDKSGSRKTKSSSSAVHRARFNEVAYKKMTSLGVAARFTPDEKKVVGELAFENVELLDVFSKKRIEMVWLENEGPDHIKIRQPALLSNLAPIAILALQDQAALEQAIANSFHDHRMVQGKGTEMLKNWGITPEFQQWRFRVVGRITLGRDEVTFSFRNVDTLVLEAINAHEFPSTSALQPRLVYIRQVHDVQDLEHVISSTIERNRRQLEDLKTASIAEAVQPDQPPPTPQPVPDLAELFSDAPAPEPHMAVAVPNAAVGQAPEPAASFVCNTCGKAYDPGEDLQDDRLLLQCRDCLKL